jgi:hypothetical protein
VIIDNKKYCPCCKCDLPTDLFGFAKQSSDGLTSYCKKCKTERRRIIRLKERRTGTGYYGSAKVKEQQKIWDRRSAKKKNKKKRNKLKLKIVGHYSNGTMACNRCKFADIRALSIDHINGDGAKHRREVPGLQLYGWLETNNFPDGFQVLCMNCQFIKRHENNEMGRKIL